MNCCIRRHVEMVVGTNKSYAIGMNRNGVFKMQAEPRLCGIFLTVGRTLDLPSAINTELLKTTCCTVDDLPSRFLSAPFFYFNLVSRCLSPVEPVYGLPFLTNGNDGTEYSTLEL